MTRLSQLTATENFHDGPIPAGERDALRFGSHLDSLIASHAANVRFYREMLVKNRKSAREWFRRGDIRMAENCRRDGWIYLTGWRVARKQLASLTTERDALVRNEEAA